MAEIWGLFSKALRPLILFSRLAWDVLRISTKKWWLLYKAQPVTASALLIGLALLFAAMLRIAFPTKPILIIAPFELPSQHATSLGMTGGTVANLVVDEVRAIVSEIKSRKGESDSNRYAPESDSSLSDVSTQANLDSGVEVGGFSIDKLVDIWTKVRQRQIIVTGDVLFGPGGVTLRGRIAGKKPLRIGPYPADEDGLNRACREFALQLITEEAPNIASSAYFNTGLDSYRKGALDEATHYFEKALEINEEFPEALNNLGVTLYEGGQLDEAIEKLEKAVTSKSDYSDALYNLGNAYAQKGQYDNAIDNYTKVLEGEREEEPRFPDAQIKLGNMFALGEYYNKAVEAYNTSLEHDPANAEVLNKLGEVFRDQGNLDQGIAKFEEALKHRPDYRPALSNLGNAQEVKGEIDAAEATFREVERTAKSIESVLLEHGNPGGSGTLLIHQYLVVSHDNEWKIPQWVAYHLLREDLQGQARRTNDFRPDPDLPKGQRAELSDYKGSGFDKGHMASPGDFTRNSMAMSDAFLLSNIAPQTPNLNRRTWKELEQDVRELASAHGHLWILTGSLFLSKDRRATKPPTTIGENRVAVPTHFYKLVLCEHMDSEFEMFAFMMPNQATPLEGSPEEYATTVDRVEELTGLDFFRELDDAVEIRLEKTKAAVWPAVEYAWSDASRIYHYATCNLVKRISPRHLRRGTAPPEGKRLHQGCPVVK